MKALKVIFQHGHFIDIETKRRIIPVQGKEFIITASPDAFTSEDVKLSIMPSMNEKDKAAWAEKEFGVDQFHCLAKAGDKFIFRIGNSRRVDGDESREYIFLCSITEDLYLFLLEGKEAYEPLNWRLAECNCKLEDCLLGSLTLTDKLEAESLNQLFSRTVMHYFSNQRSGAANALKTFFWYDHSRRITFHAVLNELFKSLDFERKVFVSSLSREHSKSTKSKK